MIKIPNVFKRVRTAGSTFDGMLVDEVNPSCQWVLDGEGKPTLKWDGTSCLINYGKLYLRYDRKPKRGTPIMQSMGLEGFKPAPDGWMPSQDPDRITGHWPGWIPARWIPGHIYHLEAFHANPNPHHFDNATYELVGPKVQSNPHGLSKHALIKHGNQPAPNFREGVPRTYNSIRNAVEKNFQFEGVVFHHPDGRMAKIRRVDFGFEWPRPLGPPHPLDGLPS